MCDRLQTMKIVVLVGLVSLVCAGVASAQERPVPKDSARVSIPGCAHNRAFIVARPPEGEPVRSDIKEGRRFRLSGPKDVLAEIKAHQRDMIEVTGLVRLNDLKGPPGVSLGGGRVRIGPGNPQAPLGANGAFDPHYTESTMDVESWRPLPASCSGK